MDRTGEDPIKVAGAAGEAVFVVVELSLLSQMAFELACHSEIDNSHQAIEQAYSACSLCAFIDECVCGLPCTGFTSFTKKQP